MSDSHGLNLKEPGTVDFSCINFFENMKYIDKEFAKKLFSVPSCSGFEIRMLEFLADWANRNQVSWNQDEYGNLYMRKGKRVENKYYPCVCAHLDTVFVDQLPLIEVNDRLTIIERNTRRGTEFFAEESGIGGDDKAGILICLELIKRTPYIKACFFREEEMGCQGSKNMDVDWFQDVGYVIGWDSPEKNRSAYASAGIALFDMDFYEIIKDTCVNHGLTNFKSEPFTDVSEIRKITDRVCMNFGNGGYNLHRKNEYIVLEETDESVGFGLDLIELLGHQLYSLPQDSSLTNKLLKYFRK